MPRRRRDGQPTAEDLSGQQQEPGAGDGEQKLAENGDTLELAQADMEEVRDLNQKISDLQMKVASVYKRIEKRGGDRAAFKLAYRMKYQSAAKTRAELEAYKKYVEWLVIPGLEEAEAAGSEG